MFRTITLAALAAALIVSPSIGMPKQQDTDRSLAAFELVVSYHCARVTGNRGGYLATIARIRERLPRRTVGTLRYHVERSRNHPPAIVTPAFCRGQIRAVTR